MANVLYIGIGGFFGSVSRHLLNEWAKSSFPNAPIYVGTAIVNILGCFAIGLIMGFLESRTHLPEEIRFVSVIGFLGGFTTFSAFGYDALHLMKSDQMSHAILSVAGQVSIGIFCVWIGYILAKVVK